MFKEVPLKNSTAFVVIDLEVFEKLSKIAYLNEVDFFNNLREHSSGCAIFQKYLKQDEGYKVETIYLHKFIAEKFLPKPSTNKKLFVSYVNRNPLDCRLENLSWRTMSELRRSQIKTPNKTGYRGVITENSKFRAVIHKDNVRYDLGTYNTAEEAASAYNKKSIELFGNTGSLNELVEQEREKSNGKTESRSQTK